MPTIEQNVGSWSTYNWSEGGDEWSGAWGGTEFLWWGTLYPRIAAFLPAATVLEIAPGYGRFTQYLKDLCDHLTIVDLTERCILACKERFAEATNITYHITDGKSLAMVPNHSFDFVFSFDSLVPC
jgi:16S rRNA A1518/A1519 N6-dimethyltransferase RsmA/KsgA/DIM1 with predicted DNA glycosylase/AP lyase activity